MTPPVHGAPSVLVTEVGNRNTGDEVAYALTARRLAAAGCRIGFLCRVRPRPEVFAGVDVDVDELMVEDFFAEATTPEELVALFARRHPEAMEKTRRLVRAYDVVAIAPGGRFTSGYNNPRALLTAAVAQDCGIPVVNLHQSVGPLDREADRRLVAAVLDRARLNIVRDDLSHAFLMRLGVRPERLVLSRDVAFDGDFDAPTETAFDVGINIRHGFNGRVRLDALRAFVERIGRKSDPSRIMVYSTTHPPGDDVRTAVDGLAEVHAGLPRWDDCLRLPGLCRVNVSDSYHGAIFSMRAGRPVICCQTDYASWKIQGTRTPGLADVEVLPGFVSAAAAGTIATRAEEALSNPGPILACQRQRIEHARDLCRRGWDAVEALLPALAGGGGVPECA